MKRMRDAYESLKDTVAAIGLAAWHLAWLAGIVWVISLVLCGTGGSDFGGEPGPGDW